MMQKKEKERINKSKKGSKIEKERRKGQKNICRQEKGKKEMI